MDEDGFREVEFKAKKTTARVVILGEEVVEAVEAYREHMGLPHDAIMFPKGSSRNPSNALSLWLARQFKKYGETVKSHDFRTTHATKHYLAHKDIKAT